MSDFVQQQNSICDFNSSDSWVILSPIEQSIKRKIEAVGTPLKDWDINIYRGVLTGYNDAFIIDTAKRDEILANCKTDEERRRTDELIRPLSCICCCLSVRGRYRRCTCSFVLVTVHKDTKNLDYNKDFTGIF